MKNNTNKDANDPLELRIGFLAHSSFKLLDKIPSISHYLMRCAVGFSTQTHKVPTEFNVCKSCGILLVPCVSLEIRCRKCTKRNRKTFKKYLKNKTHKMYHKNKMVYKCTTCCNIVNLPSVCKYNKKK
ncbi:hypothetical protein MACJ_003777 [Theileria orientalis]|uniref:Uncharacterized protein n=1 Tax=Theileria orientalis TaxID=68886 RepID=A0A976SKK1_THEOR|nr:hypothetical protein MACJ_003777 [Theileria orientalis]